MRIVLAVVFLVALALPAYILMNKKSRGWKTRYLCALLPAIFTLAVWQLASFVHAICISQGGHNTDQCVYGGVDFKFLATLSVFTMPPFLAVAVPLSLFLLIETAAKHIGEFRSREFNKR